MTPIESIYDTRLVVLLKVLMDTVESLALEVDCEPAHLLSDYLFLSTKAVHERGEEETMSKLSAGYPMLSEAIS